MPELDAKEIKNNLEEAITALNDLGPYCIEINKFVTRIGKWINEIENNLAKKALKESEAILRIKRNQNDLIHYTTRICYYLNFYYNNLFEDDIYYKLFKVDEKFKDDKKPKDYEFKDNKKFEKPEILENILGKKYDIVSTPEIRFKTKTEDEKKQAIYENTMVLHRNVRDFKEKVEEAKRILNKYNIKVKGTQPDSYDLDKLFKIISLSNDQKNILKESVNTLNKMVPYYKQFEDEYTKNKEEYSENKDTLKSYSVNMLSLLDFLDGQVSLDKTLKDTIAKTKKSLEVKITPLDPGDSFFTQTTEKMEKDIGDYIKQLKCFDDDLKEELEKTKKIFKEIGVKVK